MATEKRLIAEALKKYHDGKFTPGVYEHSIFGKAAMLLEADAVEVVRRKDCNHRADKLDCGNYLCNRKMIGMVRSNDFCSFGERRTDNA